MTPAIKLCGINTPEAACVVAALGVEYMGVICYPPSPRHITPQHAGVLKAALGDAPVKTIAVTVNPDDTLISAIMMDFHPYGLQLHGSESPSRLSEIHARYPTLTLIKAFGVENADDLALATAYAPVADRLLFDAKAPKTGLSGGTGHSFDWTMLTGREFGKPWFLSGGLNEGNVAEAIKISGAKTVDVSSGIESAPGVKDAAKMKAFVEAVQATFSS